MDYASLKSDLGKIIDSDEWDLFRQTPYAKGAYGYIQKEKRAPAFTGLLLDYLGFKAQGGSLGERVH